MKRILLIASILALAGCSADPVGQSYTDNPDITVETLFTHEGCTIYRFRDGNKHYYAKCSGSTDTVGSHTESCGKNCVHTVDENIPTYYED